MIKRFVPVSIVAALLVAGVVLSLSVGGRGGTQTQGSTAVVDPAVWEALEEANEVLVFISLREMDGPIEEWNLDLRAEHAATVQENVLSALGDGDLTDIYQPRVAALGGYITRRGVETLANHPDVIDLRKTGTVDISDYPLNESKLPAGD